MKNTEITQTKRTRSGSVCLLYFSGAARQLHWVSSWLSCCNSGAGIHISIACCACQFIKSNVAIRQFIDVHFSAAWVKNTSIKQTKRTRSGSLCLLDLSGAGRRLRWDCWRWIAGRNSMGGICTSTSDTCCARELWCCFTALRFVINPTIQLWSWYFGYCFCNHKRLPLRLWQPATHNSYRLAVLSFLTVCYISVENKRSVIPKLATSTTHPQLRH